MPKYKVKGTDILHSKVNYAEGAEIELDEKEAILLTDYLELIPGTKNETPKQEEIKQVEPVKKRSVPNKPVKEIEVRQVQTQKEHEPQTVSAANVPEVQANVVNTPATQTNAVNAPTTPEVKPQNSTQIPAAAQKVIANAITQVNKDLHNTQGKPNYQASGPTNIPILNMGKAMKWKFSWKTKTTFGKEVGIRLKEIL